MPSGPSYNWICMGVSLILQFRINVREELVYVTLIFVFVSQIHQELVCVTLITVATVPQCTVIQSTVQYRYLNCTHLKGREGP